jgi:hypothetical protein
MIKVLTGSATSCASHPQQPIGTYLTHTAQPGTPSWSLQSRSVAVRCDHCSTCAFVSPLPTATAHLDTRAFSWSALLGRLVLLVCWCWCNLPAATSSAAATLLGVCGLCCLPMLCVPTPAPRLQSAQLVNSETAEASALCAGSQQCPHCLLRVPGNVLQ